MVTFSILLLCGGVTPWVGRSVVCSVPVCRIVGSSAEGIVCCIVGSDSLIRAVVCIWRWVVVSLLVVLCGSVPVGGSVVPVGLVGGSAAWAMACVFMYRRVGEPCGESDTGFWHHTTAAANWITERCFPQSSQSGC